MTPRLIPILLLHDEGVVKSINFKNHRYIGDPVNIVRILNDKAVDELVILDIDASRERRSPRYKLLEQICNQAFMPICYGGGVRSIEEAKRIISTGIEKVSVNQTLFDLPEVVREMADDLGSQAVVASIDVQRTILRQYSVYDYLKKKGRKISLKDAIARAESIGCGEVLITDVSREGTRTGLDAALAKECVEAGKVPVIFSGGAHDLRDFTLAIKIGVSAVGVGSMVVYHGAKNAVLITYPDEQSIIEAIDVNK